jgi:ribonuclease PH
MAMAMNKLHEAKTITKFPITDFLASVSVGVVQDKTLLDLCYIEDSKAKVDMNVVMTGQGKFVEVQGTGEESPFSREELNGLLLSAEAGIREMIVIQKQALGAISNKIGIGELFAKS